MNSAIPPSLTHHNTNYCLAHLQPFSSQFNWTCKNNRNLDLRVRVKWSNHCISEELLGVAPTGAMVLHDGQNRPRVFDHDRYMWSRDLPTIVGDLFTKPATTIRLTTENNWYTFRLGMPHPLPSGEKYYCFVRLRYMYQFGSNPLSHIIRLSVESAYSRSTEPFTPHGNERRMFGRIVEQLVP